MLIAGTNGKGSTAATLASILTASGLRTGLYTSPHLARANERIRLDRAEIADDDFARLYFRVHDAAQELVLNGRLPKTGPATVLRWGDCPATSRFSPRRRSCTLPRRRLRLPCWKWAWAGGWTQPMLWIR